MRIGVSNLLWLPDADAAVARILRAHRVDAIDIAPTRYFADAAASAANQLDEWRRIGRCWQRRGITIIALQSLLHSKRDCELFGNVVSRAAMAAHLRAMLDIADAVGATRLVFGSWQNRRRRALAPATAIAAAAEFFAPLAAAAAERGAAFAIEPIFAGYGNDFLVDHTEALALVRAVDHPGLRITLDMGCVGLAGEDLESILASAGDAIGHVQLAEPQLAPLSPDNPLHRGHGPLLRRALPGRVACIEALTPADADPLDAVKQSLRVALTHYR